MQILSNHSNQSTQATAIKNIFEEANVYKILQSFNFISIISSKLILIFFCKFSLLVAMTTNQIESFGQKLCLVEGTFNKLFCKTFVKISAVR